MTRRLIVEADGGSRGNPGPAGYGAVVKDALTGEVLAEESESLGHTTNNVAEYSGLIAGLRAAGRIAPGADLDVRMDSKLVVEQMSGRWQIKHPGLRPLAREAVQAARGFRSVSYTWVPRARNAHADRLANQAMDAAASPGRPAARPRRTGGDGTGSRASGESTKEPAPGGCAGEQAGWVDGMSAGDSRSGQQGPDVGLDGRAPTGPGWVPATGVPVTTLLLRHGETPLSPERRFAGRGDIPLTEQGLRQARSAGRRLAARGGVSLIVSSPLRRALASAREVAELTGARVVVDESFAEMDFGAWEGLTTPEAAARWPAEMAAWTADLAEAPPGGESLAAVTARVLAGLAAQIAAHPGERVLVVSHVTPMKVILRHALAAPPQALLRMHLDVACLCEIDWYPGGPGVVRSLNDTAHVWAREWAEPALC